MVGQHGSESTEEILRIAKTNGWRLCRSNGQTFVYNGAYWRVIDRELLQSFFGRAAEVLGVPKEDARFFQFRGDLLKQFEASAYLPPPEREEGLVLVNFLNGTFAINHQFQYLREPSPEDFLTYQLPFPYDNSATAPMFRQFLDRVLPDKGLQQIIQEFVGYIFVSPQKLKLEKVLLLFGSGANGKSVFIEILSAMLGKENVSRYSLESITDPKGYSRAELNTKLLNLSTEISGKLDKGFFKQMASGESVEARHIYGKPFTMETYAKLIFSTNELPKETENTDGFFRRWLIVPFAVTIPESEQDKELARKIIDVELSGIFTWVLEGLNRLLMQKRFTESTIIREQVESFKQQSDSVLTYLKDEGFQKDNFEFIALKDFFRDYRVFCESAGFRPCSITTVSSRLKFAGFEMKRMSFGTIIYCKKSTAM